MESNETAIERLRKEITKVRKQVNVQEIRLTLAQAWVSFYEFAYDALLYHGINYRTLKEYKDSSKLDDAQKMPITQARQVVIEWLDKLRNGVSAAVRRKNFKLH